MHKLELASLRAAVQCWNTLKSHIWWTWNRDFSVASAHSSVISATVDALSRWIGFLRKNVHRDSVPLCTYCCFCMYFWRASLPMDRKSSVPQLLARVLFTFELSMHFVILYVGLYLECLFCIFPKSEVGDVFRLSMIHIFSGYCSSFHLVAFLSTCL